MHCGTIQYTQPYNQPHNPHNPHDNTPSIINNAYGIIKQLYTINDNDNYPILLSSIINSISEPTTPWKYTNIPQRNMSLLQRNNSNDAINIPRGILSRLSRYFMCYCCCIKSIKSKTQYQRHSTGEIAIVCVNDIIVHIRCFLYF